jgi:hypothetical protein
MRNIPHTRSYRARDQATRLRIKVRPGDPAQSEADVGVAVSDFEKKVNSPPACELAAAGDYCNLYQSKRSSFARHRLPASPGSGTSGRHRFRDLFAVMTPVLNKLQHGISFAALAEQGRQS